MCPHLVRGLYAAPRPLKSTSLAARTAVSVEAPVSWTSLVWPDFTGDLRASVGTSRGRTVGLTPRSLSQSLSSPVQGWWAHPCLLGESWHLLVVPMLQGDAMPLSRSYSVMGLRWGLRSFPPFLNSTVLAGHWGEVGTFPQSLHLQERQCPSDESLSRWESFGTRAYRSSKGHHGNLSPLGLCSTARGTRSPEGSTVTSFIVRVRHLPIRVRSECPV